MLAKGCDDFVRKPFREADILQMLEKHLDVAFVYERSSPASPSGLAQECASDTIDALGTLAPDLQANFYEATRLGDFEWQLALLEKIGDQAPALAEHLEPLVNDFAQEEILAMIEKSKEKKE